MAEIDVRVADDDIMEIKFADYGSVRRYITATRSVSVIGYDNDHAEVDISDIPNLIKALQKAMELWN